LELNDYSSGFLAVLLQAYPEFRELVAAGPEPGCFTIQFTAPSGSIFWVNTEEEERITVGLDAHHVHFGGWAKSVDAQDFQNAVEYILRLMRGEYRVAVWTREGKFAGSVTVARGEKPQPWDSGEGLSLTIKSWLAQDENGLF
jgi:hypothetical protein